MCTILIFLHRGRLDKFKGDIGWNKTETRMFTKPTQHEFSETYV